MNAPLEFLQYFAKLQLLLNIHHVLYFQCLYDYKCAVFDYMCVSTINIYALPVLNKLNLQTDDTVGTDQIHRCLFVYYTYVFEHLNMTYGIDSGRVTYIVSKFRKRVGRNISDINDHSSEQTNMTLSVEEYTSITAIIIGVAGVSIPAHVASQVMELDLKFEYTESEVYSVDENVTFRNIYGHTQSNDELVEIHRNEFNMITYSLESINFVTEKRRDSILVMCPVTRVIATLDNTTNPSSLIVHQFECKPNEELGLCPDVASKGTMRNDRVYTILTYAGLSLSGVSLVLTIVLNRKTTNQKTIHSQNVENVMISMVISQTMFMAGIGANDVYVICYVAAIVNHYSTLLMFSCMLVSIVNICSVFKGLIKNPNSLPDQSKFKIYIAISLCIPFLFVVPCVVLSLVENPPLSVTYTDGHVCFLTSPTPNLLFLTGPILFSVGLNMCCIVVILFIVVRMSIARRPWYQRYSQYIGVYIRLLMFSGFPYIFGCLGNWLDNDTLSLIFIITYSMQGVLVSLAWFCTKHKVRSIRALRRQNTRSIETITVTTLEVSP